MNNSWKFVFKKTRSANFTLRPSQRMSGIHFFKKRDFQALQRIKKQHLQHLCYHLQHLC